MGVSGGGMTAQYLATDQPGLVERLVLAVVAPCVNAGAMLGFDACGDCTGSPAPRLFPAKKKDRSVGFWASFDLKSQIRVSRLRVYHGLGHAAREEAGDFNRRVFAYLQEDLV